jgi:hypothetical protein
LPDEKSGPSRGWTWVNRRGQGFILDKFTASLAFAFKETLVPETSFCWLRQRLFTALSKHTKPGFLGIAAYIILKTWP